MLILFLYPHILYYPLFRIIDDIIPQWVTKRGTSVLNPGAGFLRIFTVAFDKLS